MNKLSRLCSQKCNLKFHLKRMCEWQKFQVYQNVSNMSSVNFSAWFIDCSWCYVIVMCYILLSQLPCYYSHPSTTPPAPSIIISVYSRRMKVSRLKRFEWIESGKLLTLHILTPALLLVLI